MLTTTAIIALVFLSMVVDAGMYHNKIHAGVTISGQTVSGLTQDEAVDQITRYVTQAQSGPIKLTIGGKSWDLHPDSVSVKFDVAGSVAAAMGLTRDSNHAVDLVHKLQLYFNGRDVSLGGTVDTASLDAVIDQIAAEVDKPAVNSALAIRGAKLTAVKGRNGLVVDKDALRQQLTAILLSLERTTELTEITVPMVVDEPEVTAEDNKEAFAKTKTMISAPLTLTSGDLSWTFDPQELAGYIEFRSEAVNGVSTLVPYLSSAKMATRLDEIAQEAATPPVDAYFVADGDKARVVPAVDGTTLDPAKTVEALTTAALLTTGRTAEAAVTSQEAEFTTADAEAMGIKDLLASFKTSHWGSENRQTNVRMTTKYITDEDSRYLAPGEEFSFKKAVGPRTADRGFKKAPGIVPGIVLEDVYGGGICQVSTTLFNAVIEAGLKVTERRNHTMFFAHYPMGRDATVTDNGPDLRFVNDTGHYIWITGTSDGVRTTLSIYGTDDGRKVDIPKLGASDWYGVWGPYTHTTLDPMLPTGVSVLVDPGQRAKMCMLNMTVTWPDGKVQKYQFESNYKHIYRVVRVGTATTVSTLPLTTSPPTTAP